MQAKEDKDKPLKILQLESSNNWGGQEDRLVRESAWLAERGHKILLGCNDTAAIAGRAGAAGIEVRAIPLRMNIDIAGLKALASLVRKEKPDVIHAHSSKDAWFSFWFHQAGVPVVRTRHTTLPPSMPRGRRFIYRHGCRRLIASAGFIAKTMRDSLGVAPENIDVVGECVDTKEFCPGDGSAFREEFGIPTGAPLFGLVAMLRREKGHATFLQAARQVLRQRPDARFAIVGGNASDNVVELLIHEILRSEFAGLSPAPVILTGFRRDIPCIMRALDCLVVPSWQEAQTLVIPQAFATAKPVIASRVGGIPELVTDGESGLLIPPADPENLAEAMLKIAGDPSLASRLAAEGRRFAERELAVDVKMSQLLTSYRRAAAPATAAA
ncbi:MAG: glycosyltransferase family 4 protein [Chthoniobacterales bacterium]|nr:glycosyltransferase family 4 protein [Chthoniobacterales bacterium]